MWGVDYCLLILRGLMGYKKITRPLYPKNILTHGAHAQANIEARITPNASTSITLIKPAKTLIHIHTRRVMFSDSFGTSRYV